MFGIRAALRRAAALALFVPVCLMGLGGAAQAQIGSDRYAAIVTDGRGNVLIAASPDELRHPASLTKMMTVYMAFEALKEGRVNLSSVIRVSPEAASRPPSRLRLAAGSTLTVEEAILALVTKSANDAAAALGEFLAGGNEARFAQMMTMRARALGMSRTTFRNASGLPDVEQVTTARDMALLGRRLIQDFPDRYGVFSTHAFNFRGRTIFNHNRLLDEYEGADGIKTGYVNDSGFNLVASAQREGVRLVAAVFGGSSGRERDRHMMALLDQGFAQQGVGPRNPTMARRPQAPVLLAGARAATQAAAPAARGRVVLARATTTIGLRPAVTAQRSLRQSARIEQGDTTGRPSGRVAQRPQATPARAAAKPSTPPATRSAANHRRRAG